VADAPGSADSATGARAKSPSRLDANRSSPDDIARARALDQEGVREFRDGRYNDAIRYFSEAYKLGAPSSELWNMARCYLKLDQAEEASAALERYLIQTDLSDDDRANARRELDRLGRRRSLVTVASSPSGALVFIDGKRIGRTPASTEISADPHTIVIKLEGYDPYVQRVVARYGRAIIVDASLRGPSRGGETIGVGLQPMGARARRVFTGSVEAAGIWSRLGSVGVPLHPAALVSMAYVPYEHDRLDIGVGMRLTITYDSWDNPGGAPALTCGLGGRETAPALGTFADGAVGYRPTDRLHLGTDVGLGFASEIGGALGGEVFTPSCAASPGLVPAGHVGSEVSYAVVPGLRLLVSPLVFEVMPAFRGAVDSGSAWFRIGAGAGFALDL
jgi:hypothetical protein